MLPLNSHSARAIAFGLTMFASSALNNVFVTYYLELFTSVSNVSGSWFYIGQLAYMIWNATNDPVFGWLSDNWDRLGFTSDIPKGISRAANLASRRAWVIRWGGLMWAAAFVTTWWPPSAAMADVDSDDEPVMGWARFIGGVHFIFVLCFYDGMLTVVEVNHSALLADLTHSDARRAQFLAYSATCAAIGSFSSFGAHALWDVADLRNFRLFNLVLALVCAAIFVVSAHGLDPATNPLDEGDHEDDGAAVVRNASDRKGVDGTNGDLVAGEDDAGSSAMRQRGARGDDGPGAASGGNGGSDDNAKPSDAWGSQTIYQRVQLFLSQILSSRNFVLFLALSSLQTFDCAYEKNFFAASIDAVGGDGVSQGARALIVSLSFFLPHVLTVVAYPVIRRVGVYQAVANLLNVRIAVLLVGWLVGSATPLSACIFVLCNRVASEGLCRLFPLVVSDLIDEDMFLHRRERSFSASIVGTTSFCSKFGVSLAPMLGHALLSEDLRTLLPSAAASTIVGTHPSDSVVAAAARGAAASSSSAAAAAADGVVEAAAARAHVLLLLLVIATCVVLVQRVLWRMYSLHGGYLERVKVAVTSDGDADAAEAGTRGSHAAA